MDKIIHVAFLFLLCIALNTTVARTNSGEINMQHQLAGYSLDNRDAYKRATAVFEATIIDQGLVSPGPPSEAYYEGMRIKVTQNFKGQSHGEMIIDLSVKTRPLDKSASVPRKGDTVIVFMGGDDVSTNRVLKLLMSTIENRDSVQRIKNQTNFEEGGEEVTSPNNHPDMGDLSPVIKAFKANPGFREDSAKKLLPYLTKGMAADAVVELLGAPTDKDDRVWRYAVFYSKAIEVIFDEKGVVTEIVPVGIEDD